MIIQEDDVRIADGRDRLQAYWDRIGPSDADIIGYAINPQFQGKPAWPNTRQSYRVVRPPGAVIIASDGLSEPFVGTDMEDANGFNMEVFIETPDLVDADLLTIGASWAFYLIENFAMNVADSVGLTQNLRAHGVMSTEFPDMESLPRAWLDARGSAGFLINTPLQGRDGEIPDMPFAPVMIVALTLIRPRELVFVREHGQAARADLVQRLSAARWGWRSSLLRPSLV